MTTETILEYFTQNLEKVAIINDVLPCKAARRDAIANWKLWGYEYTSDLISMAPFTFAMRCHLIQLAL